MSTETLKKAAIICFIIALGGLLLGGLFANREAPPYPGRVMAPDETVLFTKADILSGQDVYQRYGLMDHGSVWGHGTQRGMEFSAVTLHLIGGKVREQISISAYGRPNERLTEEERDLVDIRTRRLMKANNYDPAEDALPLEPPQVSALNETVEFWEHTFRDGNPPPVPAPTTVTQTTGLTNLKSAMSLQLKRISGQSAG